jgi:hypothetical protein
MAAITATVMAVSDVQTSALFDDFSSGLAEIDDRSICPPLMEDPSPPTVFPIPETLVVFFTTLGPSWSPKLQFTKSCCTAIP